MELQQPLRVLWLVKALGRGGAEQLLLNAARTRDTEAYDVTCAYLIHHDPQFISELFETGVVLEYLGAHPRAGGWVPALWKLLRSREFDVVHIHSPLLGSVARLLLRFTPTSTRPAVVTTEHNLWGAFHPLTRHANAITIRWDDLVVAVSSAVRDSMSPAVQERCVVVTHGVNLESLGLLRGGEAEAPTPEVASPPILLTVANLVPKKDHANLLQALALLRLRGTRFRALLAGDGPLRGQIEREIAALDLGEMVELLGSRDDVPTLMNESTVLVLSSKDEGLPVVVMEAMALGLPVVGSAVGGMPEALEGTGAAVLVPPRDATALADALGRVLADSRQLTEMSESALRVAPRFDAAVSTRWFEQRYLALHRNRAT